MRTKAKLLSGFIIMLPLFFCTAWEVRKIEEKSFNFESGGMISISADRGDVIVSSWKKEVVALKMIKTAWGRDKHEAELFLKNIDVKIHKTNNRLVIKEIDINKRNFNFFDLFDSDFWKSGGYGSRVDFELRVPESVNLKIECDEGDVNVTGISGGLSVELDEGDLDVSNIISEDIQIFIDEGDVFLSEIENSENGFVNIEADEGSIIINGNILGEADIDVDEGDIVIRNVSLSRCWLVSDEGNIELDFFPLEEGDYRLETDEGDIEINIPDDSNLGIRMQTNEGRIDTDFSLNKWDRDDGEVVDGIIGRKLAYLKAFTDEGYISLRKKMR